MRVLLINPTSHFETLGSNPAALEDSRGHSPPLGLLCLAGALEAHSSHHVSVLDASAEELTFSQIATAIEEAKPDVVGITAMTQLLIDVMRIVEITKASAPGARIIIGGPHVNLFPEETINLPGVDLVVLGEAEHVFPKIIDCIDDAKALKSIPGLVFFSEGQLVRTPPPSFISDLDALPFAARHLTNVNLYDSVLSPRKPVTTIFSSRGCPYLCSFCDRPHLGKKFRARSANNVVDEMEECIRLGIHEFLFYDDTFTVRRERVIDICEQIRKRKLDVGFDIRTRIDTVDEEMLRHLKRAGCRAIHYGIEAGTEKILTVLKKGIALDEARSVLAATKAQGIQTLAYFMIGSPTETEQDILQTFKFARELDPDYLHLTILTPFPGTEIYFKGLETGIIETDVWRDFARAPHMAFTPPHWRERFTIEELNHLLLQGYKSFYRRPNYIIKRLKKVRSIDELRTKAKAGMRILTMKSKTR